jgi:hypothetical protein
MICLRELIEDWTGCCACVLVCLCVDDVSLPLIFTTLIYLFSSFDYLMLSSDLEGFSSLGQIGTRFKLR